MYIVSMVYVHRYTVDTHTNNIMDISQMKQSLMYYKLEFYNLII